MIDDYFQRIIFHFISRVKYKIGIKMLEFDILFLSKISKFAIDINYHLMSAILKSSYIPEMNSSTHR